MSIKPYSDFDFKNPNYLPIIQKRVELLNTLKTNPQLLANVKLHYRHNPVDFIQDWLITYDPRLAFRKDRSAYMPFLLFPKQQDFINWLYTKLEEQEDGLAEKSRDVGFTWLCVAFTVWAFVFVDDIKIGWGSRKADLVDKKDEPDSIFEKIRATLSTIPDIFFNVFKEPGTKRYRKFDLKKDAPYMKIINHANGATISGEGGDNIGRGGRNTMYFVDEAAFIENIKSTLAALSENSNVKIYFSTYSGTNEFYRMRKSGILDVFTFRWSDDPRKDKAWYEKKKATTDPLIFAQEIEMDPNSSNGNSFIPNMWILSAIDFVINPSGVKTLGFDVAGGNDDNVIRGDNFAKAIRQDIAITHIEEWKYLDSDTSADTKKVYFQARDENIFNINYDSIGVGAGAHGEFKRLKKENNDSFSKRVNIQGVNVAVGASDEFCEALGAKYNERLLNLKAELWYRMRIRFKKTYEHVTGKQQHPHDELISIPNNEDLIDELSSPKLVITDNGKYKVESKKELGKRGIKSPNLADAVALTFAPQKRIIAW